MTSTDTHTAVSQGYTSSEQKCPQISGPEIKRYVTTLSATKSCLSRLSSTLVMNT